MTSPDLQPLAVNVFSTIYQGVIGAVAFGMVLGVWFATPRPDGACCAVVKQVPP